MTISLPVHPRTGLTALGLRRDGRPIWPVMGGDGRTDPPNPPAPPAPPAPPTPPAPGDPAKPDEPLGPAGLKALQEERAARKELEDQVAKLKPLEKLLDAFGGEKPKDGQTQIDQLTERFAQQEKALTDERTARFKSEVALDKKLTADQAAMLVGTTKEELAAHADKLLELFGKPADDGTATKRGGTPRPDPAQGARPGGQPSRKDAGLAEARKRFGPKPGAATT